MMYDPAATLSHKAADTEYLRPTTISSLFRRGVFFVSLQRKTFRRREASKDVKPLVTEVAGAESVKNAPIHSVQTEEAFLFFLLQ